MLAVCTRVHFPARSLENKKTHSEKTFYVFVEKVFSYISGNETFYPQA